MHSRLVKDFQLCASREQSSLNLLGLIGFFPELHSGPQKWVKRLASIPMKVLGSRSGSLGKAVPNRGFAWKAKNWKNRTKL